MSEFAGSLGLQSGIVIAVLIAAVFLVERLGGDEVLLRRGTQVILAVALTLTVLAATNAFIRPPDAPEDLTSIGFDGSEEDQQGLRDFARETSERESESGTIHLAVAIALVAAGLLALKRYVLLPVSLLLAGVMLLLLGAPPGDVRPTFTDTFNALYASQLPGSAEPGQERDIAQFVVLFLGTAMLFYFAALRWEALAPEMVSAAVPVSEPSPDPESPPDEY